MVLGSITTFAVIVIDRDGRVTGWNTGAERILQWTQLEMRGELIDRIFTPEDRSVGRVAEEMRLALENGKAGNEGWRLRRDGSRFWASGEMTPLGRPGEHAGFVKVLRDRTAEHLAAQALSVAEARLRQAQAAGGFGLFTVDVAEEVLTPTPEFCRLYGLEVQPAYPTSAVEAQVLAEDRHLASSADARRRGVAPRDVEYRVRLADTGEVRWIARIGEFEFDDDERPVRFFGAARDVTEERRARDALSRSEARYRALFEAVDDGFCIIEFIDGPHGPMSDYVHVEANLGYQRQTGIPDVVGKRLREIAPNDADGWLELYGEVLRTGRPLRFERFFVEVERHIEVSAARVEPESRRQVSVLFRDITARKSADAALRASEALARENIQRVQLALTAGAIIGTWFWDLPTDRFTVDQGFADAFGLDPALGRDGLSLEQVTATVHPEDRPGLVASIDAAIARGGAYAHQYRVRRADGRYYWIEANGRVEHGADGTPLSFPGVLLDVEERRAVEAERDRAAAALRALNETLEQRVAERTAELMEAEERLRQSQKMEAVGQLTGGLAHDFNNLLAGVSGALEMLNTRLNQGRLADAEKYITAAQGAARRAAALTHRLLAFSRRQTLDPRPTNVNALVSGMTDLIQRTVGPGILVEMVGAAALWPTLVDPSQLENALLNLCINARDAMPDGGRLTIETANKWLDRAASRTHEMPEGQYVSLCVTDTGTGMPPEVIAKAFDPFFTTKPLGQGTGLGLSMIYGFARQSGGQVRIYSEIGQGTTVCIYLPRHYGEVTEDALASGVTLAERSDAGETVLVVDDEPTVRMLVADVLEELGYLVIEAADSMAGLELLRSAARVDLLISDVGLPGGMNGRQMAEAARQTRPDLKVLFITGYAENAVIGSGHLDPGMHVLTKPFAIDGLAARVRELMTG
jgi:PAS domain S-box-containing protein